MLKSHPRSRFRSITDSTGQPCHAPAFTSTAKAFISLVEKWPFPAGLSSLNGLRHHNDDTFHHTLSFKGLFSPRGDNLFDTTPKARLMNCPMGFHAPFP